MPLLLQTDSARHDVAGSKAFPLARISFYRQCQCAFSMLSEPAAALSLPTEEMKCTAFCSLYQQMILLCLALRACSLLVFSLLRSA